MRSRGVKETGSACFNLWQETGMIKQDHEKNSIETIKKSSRIYEGFSLIYVSTLLDVLMVFLYKGQSTLFKTTRISI